MELHSNYKINTKKIILTENVYARLLGMINITGFKKQLTNQSEIPNGGYEYIVMLYGKVNEEGDIVFSEVNDTDYKVFDGKSSIDPDIQPKLFAEYAYRLQSSDINCCAYVHTHPYGKTESSRIFSDADIDYYKTTFKSSVFSKILKKPIINLGGMMSNSASNLPSEDDINFVYYNESTDEMEYLPNIYVEIDGRILPLKQQKETIYFDSTNHIYNGEQLKNDESYSPVDINRIYLELDEHSTSKRR